MRKCILIATMAASLLASSACQHRTDMPDDVVDTATLTAFLADAYRLEASFATKFNYHYDSIPDGALAAYDELLRRHNLDADEVERSINYYASQPELYSKIHERILGIIRVPKQ